MFPIDFLRRAAERFPDRIAAGDGARQVTFAELMERADALAAWFQASAGKDRVTVGACAPNTLEHLVAIVAVHAAGGVLVPLNYRNSAAEIADLIAAAKPDLVFADVSTEEKVGSFGNVVIGGKIWPFYGADYHTIVEKWRGERPQWPAVAPEDASAIKFTGGSSSRPKGVVQSFRCISTLIANMMTTFRFDADDVHFCVAPIGHGAGTFMVPVLAAGGSNRLLKEPKAVGVLDGLEREGVTTLFAPPTLIYSVVEAAGDRRPEFPALRRVIYGAAPMPPERVAEARSFFRGKLASVYGQTEMPALMTVLRAEELADDRNLASAGRASPFVRLGIMDPQGKVLGPGDMGEIVARSDMMMTGYLEMPEKTADTIVDGWLHTGDIGYLDERGFLFIKDRLRDVIITGGFNVYPSDVEAALARHPAVYECVVFGVPDTRWGERVEAVVQIHPNRSASAEELIAHVKTLIGSLKAPKLVHVVRELPRSAAGKVLRREAREEVLRLRSEATVETHA